MSWEDVKNEMVKEKGLSEEAADQIGEYVSMQGETTDITQLMLAWLFFCCWKLQSGMHIQLKLGSAAGPIQFKAVKEVNKEVLVGRNVAF